MENQIVGIDDAEYDGKKFKKVILASGKVHNVKQGRGGALKEKWPLLEVGKIFKPKLGTFQGKSYVEDFEVEDAPAGSAPVRPPFSADPAKSFSIEQQVAVKLMFDLRIAIGDKMNTTEAGLYLDALSWIAERIGREELPTLGGAPANPATIPATSVEASPNAPELPRPPYHSNRQFMEAWHEVVDPVTKAKFSSEAILEICKAEKYQDMLTLAAHKAMMAYMTSYSY